MPRRKREEGEEEYQPASDPFWKDECAPLFKFLSKPRTIPQMEEWGREHGHNKAKIWHLLAWLRINRLVMYDHLIGRWIRPDALLKGNEPR